MIQQIFINLPVRDLPSAKDFYRALGATNNPQFTDDTAACMVFSDSIFVMLLTHAKWASFTQKPIPPKVHSEVMLALSCDSRASVDTMLQAVSNHGGIVDVNPKQDLGFMYNRSFEDLDGHVWEAFFMDVSQASFPGG